MANPIKDFPTNKSKENKPKKVETRLQSVNYGFTFSDLNSIKNLVPTPKPVSKKTVTVKEELKEYANERQNSSIIGDTHSRSTFLISDETSEALNDLTFYLEVTNSIGSSFTEGKSKEVINEGRVMSKGVKSKIVNHSVSKFLEDYKNQLGVIPKVQHKRFKVNKVNHNVYLFTENGKTYYIETDNRGRTVQELSTANYSKDELQQKFDAINDESVKTGRPSKK